MTTEATTDLLAYLTRLDEKVNRLSGMDQKLTQVLDLLVSQSTVKEFYTTAEIAGIVQKDEFTVREWCRLGRINAVKKTSGRGKHKGWAIPHAELLRYQREGLLPDLRSRSAVA
jgi:hypothetical protein